MGGWRDTAAGGVSENCHCVATDSGLIVDVRL